MTNSKKSFFIRASTMLLSLLVIALPRTASAFSAAGDFSTASNPNGTWSYGSSTTLGSAFIPSTIPTNHYSGLTLDGWLGTSDSSGTPYVLHNSGTVNAFPGDATYPPGQLAEHPGALGQYSIVRWTAPSSGTFSISATFSGLGASDSADVHILKDGVSFFNANVNGSPSPQSFSGLQSVLVGDTIDFVTGSGTGGNSGDTTGLSATIVPEPTTLGLVAMSLVSLLSFRFLKRK